MTTLNPFDLLGDDAEDPSQIVLSLPKKIEKPAAAAPVQPAKAAKLPTKPLPPSQAGNICFILVRREIEQLLVFQTC